MVQQRHGVPGSADHHDLASGLHQLRERRTGTVAVVERVVVGEPARALAEGRDRRARRAAAPGLRPGPQELGQGAVVPGRAGRRRVERRDVQPPARGYPPVGVEQFVVPRVPVGVGQHGAARGHGVEQGADHCVGTVEQPADLAERAVGEHGVTGSQAEPAQVGGEVGARDEGHRVRSSGRRGVRCRRPGQRAWQVRAGTGPEHPLELRTNTTNLHQHRHSPHAKSCRTTWKVLLISRGHGPRRSISSPLRSTFQPFNTHGRSITRESG